jgi:hypothetical protein
VAEKIPGFKDAIKQLNVQKLPVMSQTEPRFFRKSVFTEKHIGL